MFYLVSWRNLSFLKLAITSFRKRLSAAYILTFIPHIILIFIPHSSLELVCANIFNLFYIYRINLVPTRVEKYNSKMSKFSS